MKRSTTPRSKPHKPISVKSAAAFVLSRSDKELIFARNKPNRLPFAIALCLFRESGTFASDLRIIGKKRLGEIASQLSIAHPLMKQLVVSERTLERFRADIRQAEKFREVRRADHQPLADWLRENAVRETRDIEVLTEKCEQHCQELRIEPPAADRMERIVRNAIAGYEEAFCEAVNNALSDDTRRALFDLLRLEGIPAENEKDKDLRTRLLRLRASPGNAGLKGIMKEIEKLATLRNVNLPKGLFDIALPHEVKKYRVRADVESPFELRRHPRPLRYTILAAFVHQRSMTVTDNLVDLLVETIHQIGKRAENKADNEFKGKEQGRSAREIRELMLTVAMVSLENPDGTIKDTIYPIIGAEDSLRELVQELKTKKDSLKKIIRAHINSSYRHHYRRMVPDLLSMLEFRSNNEFHQPVIEGLELVRKYAAIKSEFYPERETVPLEGIVKDTWNEFVFHEAEDGTRLINRAAYEICLLMALREKLRCKEIWVVGADRYRNPDEDLPPDFEEKRAEYYGTLDLPLDPKQFISEVKAKLDYALKSFDRNLPVNPDVEITTSNGKPWIKLRPLEPQNSPDNIQALKAEINKEWVSVQLLDILKESDFRAKFTGALRSPTAYETMPKKELQPKLLLAIYGLATNTGIKAMAANGTSFSEDELRYVVRRYLSVEGMREANNILVNSTLKIRNKAIWGIGTSCASDSKHFGAWGHNLRTRFHGRYHKLGVVIYSHVDKKYLCVYSQIKSALSSEVAAMFEGVIRHCADMDIERQYVDSHGQSTVAFTFSYMLGFELMPRIKNIGPQRLSRPDLTPEAYPNLSEILYDRAIDWKLIEQHYDQIVKYVTAVRLRTGDAEAILRRFTRKNAEHATYQAIMELGRAIKTIFLCQYLSSRELRQEINEGLNVVENWHSANDFVFFGKQAEMASNNMEQHELSMLCLQLGQNSMGFINTLIIQRILARPHWQGRLTARDLKALSPLMWDHINPFGKFELNMNSRMELD